MTKRVVRALRGLSMALTVICISSAVPVDAAVFTTTTTADGLDTLPGDGVCNNGAGECTLRAAIIEANALPGPDTIKFGIFPGPYVLTIPGTGEDFAALGDLDIKDDLTIFFNLRFIGTPTPPIVDAGGLDRVFHVHPGAGVTIQGLVIQNGDTTYAEESSGSGIFNEGTLTLVSTTVTQNSRADAVFNTGTLTVLTSTIRDNGTTGISNQRTLTVVNSTISGNGSGGGIQNFAPPEFPVLIFNSTISGNLNEIFGGSWLYGAGIHNKGTLTLLHSTVADNIFGAPLSNDGPSAVTFVGHTILSTTNEDTLDTDVCPELDFAPDPVSLGHNLIAKHASPSGFKCYSPAHPTDKNVFDALLGPLLDNGGPTFTQALTTGSLAIDMGDASVCPPIDQRGNARPAGANCDTGAFEVSANLSFISGKVFEMLLTKTSGEQTQDCFRFEADNVLVSDRFGRGAWREGELIGLGIPLMTTTSSGLRLTATVQALRSSLSGSAQDAGGIRYTVTGSENQSCRLR